MNLKKRLWWPMFSYLSSAGYKVRKVEMEDINVGMIQALFDSVGLEVTRLSVCPKGIDGTTWVTIQAKSKGEEYGK